MNKFLVCFALVVCLSFSALSVVASKSRPNKVYKFDDMTADGISVSGKETHRFSTSFETAVGGREDNGCSYKVVAGENTATTGNSQYVLTIPIGNSESSVVTTEFDLYPHITANPTAKDNVVPALLINISNINVVWLNTKGMQSVQQSWKEVLTTDSFNGLWSKVAITVDKAQGTFTVYFNGLPIITNVMLPSSYSDDGTIKLEWNYWYNAPGPDCYFAFDNIISYDGMLVPDDKITWKTQDGEIHSVSDITAGDKVSVTYEKYNCDGEATELTAILLVRNGSKLVSARSKKVFVPVSDEPTIIEAEEVEITDTNQLEIKYVFLNSWEERIPLCEAYSLR